jgi:hypothetical protein
MARKNLREILIELKPSSSFSINEARLLSKINWRVLISSLNKDLKMEAESFFYFVEGFVEDVDEGFVDVNYKDEELGQRFNKLLSKLEFVSDESLIGLDFQNN